MAFLKYDSVLYMQFANRQQLFWPGSEGKGIELCYGIWTGPVPVLRPFRTRHGSFRFILLRV
jgi:hypothetical protein